MTARADVDLRRRVDHLERELAQARLALEEFTYTVSHDLRAPLRHIHSFVGVVREDMAQACDPVLAGHLDTIAGAAAELGRLMDGLALLSRVDRAALEPGAVELARLVDDVRRQLEPDGPSARPVRWQIAPDLPRVRGDLALLGQMLAAVLGNACKFSRDRAEPVISIGWMPLEHGMCEIHIQDNGVGFDPRMQERLFRVFQRLHSAREFDGIGIGLALARRVVERHGGRIRAQGESGQGCRVSFSLPLA